MPHIIIGTAGHIDHGKTALVKALTGVDTDRLKEEKERGLTIDLGFAHLGDQATIIDVPGHEKFIRNMVAGVSTIDLVIFVVAADDGVMPQTREHLDILKILQVKNGLIVISKKDLVESDWLELVKDDIRKLTKGSFLENAPIFAASTLTGDGLPEIRAEIEKLLNINQLKKDRGLFWMPIDRSFVMKGFGTVVTGSVLSGRLSEGEHVDLLPPDLNVRVRGLQSHGKKVNAVATGDRAAINLQAVEKQRVQRGDVLAAHGYFKSSKRFDARLHLLESAPRALKTRSRVRVHVGTTEVMARLLVFGAAKIEPGAEAFVQLQLEVPAVARRLDAFVIRQYSPTITIGGGVILDSNPERHKLSDPTVVQQLQALEKENPIEVLEGKLLAEKHSLLTLEQLSADLATAKDTMSKHIQELEKQGKAVLFRKAGQDAVTHQLNFEATKSLILETIENFHLKNPTKPGLPKAGFKDRFPGKIDPELLKYILGFLIKDGEIVDSTGLIALKSHKITLSPEQELLRENIKKMLFEGAFSPPSEIDMGERLNASLKQVQQVLTLMIVLEEIVRAEDNLFFHPQRVQEAREKVVTYLKKNGEVTVSHFKELLGNTSRKYALPLLLYFDGKGVTQRNGDVRILGRLE